MSTTTDVLSLFKYDPVADADSTFNITQALNNNWDKLDAAILLAIAAAGAYNPEESYAVGDYCTYKGKLRKCSTAIPTGEAWTEAHWTTTTVAAEMQELSSQLSNVVRVNPGYGNTFFGDDLNDWKRLGTYDSIGKNPDTVTVNAPPDTDGWGVVTVLSASDNINRPTIQLYNPLNFSKGNPPYIIDFLEIRGQNGESLYFLHRRRNSTCRWRMVLPHCSPAPTGRISSRRSQSADVQPMGSRTTLQSLRSLLDFVR